MSKATSCKDAIKAWAAKTGQKPEEAEVVKLFYQFPPIERMDASLSSLKGCVHLSLSSNNIDRISGLNSLPNLKILSLGRNLIKRIEGLDGVKDTLEQLWISYNMIEKLGPLISLKRLRCLFIGNNLIASFGEIERLAELPDLQELVLVGNPIHQQHASTGNWRREVVRRLPGLKKLDGLPVTDDDRE